MYMLDTDTCICVLKNRSDHLKNKFKAIKSLCISSITYAELCYGIENGEASLRQQRYEQLESFTRRLLIDSWNIDAARHYGVIRSLLKKQGQSIGSNDLLIASHCRSMEAVLVTNNVREFSRIPDLTLENWIER